MIQSNQRSVLMAAWLSVGVLSFGLQAQESKLKTAEINQRLDRTKAGQALASQSNVANVPVLISPANGAVLDNGRTDHLDEMIWDFDWGNVAGATAYHLYVIGPNSQVPTIDNMEITPSDYREASNTFVPNADRLNWQWRVRAKVDEVWGEWSETRFFHLEPANTDPINRAELVASRLYLRTGRNSGPEVDNPVAGQQYFIHYDWKNTGTGGAWQFQLIIKINGTALCEEVRGTPGNSVHSNWCDTPVTWPSGANILSLNLDGSNIIPELNESDNTASRTYPSGNQAPIVVNPIPSQILTAGGAAFVRNLNAAPVVFSDPDGDVLSYTASSSALGIATASISSGSTLRVTPVNGGSATITVTANDGRGGTASTSFVVTVNSQNGIPFVVNPIPSQILLAGGAAFVRNLNAAPVVFSDPDGDALTYTASSSAPGIAAASISSGSTLRVTPVNAGSATVTVTANDGKGGAASNSFNVTVVIDENGTIQPEVAISQPIGAEFTVAVSVSNVQNLFGVSFELHYTNTAFVDFVSAEPGEFLGNDVIFLPTPDDPSGKISIGITRKSGQGGVSGSGVVARVRFRTLSSTPHGTQSLFSLSNVSANDPVGNSISLTPESATVTFIQTGVIVWPGDTNNDGVVNQADVLPIGLHWGRTGPQRQNRSLNWIGQAAQQWTPVAATFADANGDGIVNQADVLPIGLNWNRTHTANLAKTDVTSRQVPVVASATLEAELNSSTPIPGQEFFININAREVTDLFGLAFELSTDRPELLQILSVETAELLGNDVIFYTNVDDAAGKVAVGLSRKADQSGVDDAGSVVRIKAKLSPKAKSGEIITLTLKNVVASNAAGLPIAINLSASRSEIVVGGSGMTVEVISDYRLDQNYPNPFNPGTVIEYALPQAGPVVMKVYNAVGQEIRTLMNEFQQAGHHPINWDGRDDRGRMVPSGIYLYRLQAGTFVQSRKMQLVR